MKHKEKQHLLLPETKFTFNYSTNYVKYQQKLGKNRKNLELPFGSSMKVSDKIPIRESENSLIRSEPLGIVTRSDIGV